MILDELTAFSNLYGSNEDLVLAGGGNTSAKDGGVMYIKGSGTSLGTITADGFVKMNRGRLAGIFTKTYPDDDKEREAASLADLMAAREEGETGRPSVETTLHSLFAYRYVLHLHPVLVNGLTCSLGGEKLAKEIFGGDAVWIEPCRPGYILAKICRDAIEAFRNRTGKDCDVIFLANHGVFIAADEPSELGEKLESILSALYARLGREPDFTAGAFIPDRADEAFAEIRKAIPGSVVSCDMSAAALEIAADPGKIGKPFTPDHIVYCRAYPVCVDDPGRIAEKTKEYLDTCGYLPKIFIVKDAGIFAADATAKGSETALALALDAVKIAVYSESFGGARYMSGELTDFIVNWEAEAYRSKAAK